MKQLTLSLLLMLLPFTASATPVEIDGIWYNLVAKVKTAEVTQILSGFYSGSIEIPEKVSYEGSEYRVARIGNDAFEACSDLTSITIPGSVTSIGNEAFNGCSGLTSVTFPQSVTSIGNRAFMGCSRLTSVTIPNSVTSIEGYAFAYCFGLTSITIPNSVTSIEGSAFEGCSSLKSVTIPNSVTGIEGSAFSGCSGLTSITIPNNVTSIGNNAFEGCSSLTSVTFPKSVTSIGNNAFKGCSGLTTITIGNGVKYILEKAFAQCPELTDVYCMAEELSSNNWESGLLYTDALAFEGSYIEAATLHVPESAINAYKTINPWSGFGMFVTLSGEETETPKCATPTISFEDKKIKFSCETEGVEFVSNISTADAKDYYDTEITLAYKYKVTVYATKNGYENSDTATAEIMATGKLGDLNGDGKVNVADHVKLSEIIMSEK